jgi:hypothetical protein
MLDTYTTSTAVWNMTLSILVHSSVLKEIIAPVFRVEDTKMEK